MGSFNICKIPLECLSCCLGQHLEAGVLICAGDKKSIPIPHSGIGPSFGHPYTNTSTKERRMHVFSSRYGMSSSAWQGHATESFPRPFPFSYCCVYMVTRNAHAPAGMPPKYAPGWQAAPCRRSMVRLTVEDNRNC